MSRGYRHERKSARKKLYLAAKKNDVHEIIRLLTERPDIIDTRAKYGRTALWLAAARGNEWAIKTLVLFGSNALDTPDNNDITPMDTTYFHLRGGTAELLVRLGSKALFVDNLYCYYFNAYKYLAGVEDDKYYDENEAADVRFRVYFRCSLALRLIFDLEKTSIITNQV